MLVEAITITAILAGCFASVWYAKNKFQPEIERNLGRKEDPVVEMEFPHQKKEQ